MKTISELLEYVIEAGHHREGKNFITVSNTCNAIRCVYSPRSSRKYFC